MPHQKNDFLRKTMKAKALRTNFQELHMHLKNNVRRFERNQTFNYREYMCMGRNQFINVLS